MTEITAGSFYRDTFIIVDSGASNLSALARLLPDMVEAIELELMETDYVVRDAVKLLHQALDNAWNRWHSAGGFDINTDEAVRLHVRVLVSMSYEVDTMRRVAAHPIMRLMVDQMRFLASLDMPENPLYHIHWQEAYDICEAKAKEMAE